MLLICLNGDESCFLCVFVFVNAHLCVCARMNDGIKKDVKTQKNR